MSKAGTTVNSISQLVLSMQDKKHRQKQAANSRDEGKLKHKLFQKSREGHNLPWGNPMKMLQVRSNYARNRVVLISGAELILHFDSHGLAEMPEHKVDLLKAEMLVRPGRYSIVESVDDHIPTPAPPLAAASAEVRSQVEDLLASLKQEETIIEEVDAEVDEFLEIESDITEEE